MNVGVAKNNATGVIVYYDMDDPADFKKALEIISGKRKQDTPISKEMYLKQLENNHALITDITLLVIVASKMSVQSEESRLKSFEEHYLPLENKALEFVDNGVTHKSPRRDLIRHRLATIIGDDYITPCASLYEKKSN